MPISAVVLDTNLLVLLIVGAASPSYIAKHKRLHGYTEEDFLLLTALLTAAQRVVVTPNTVTETSNLAGYIGEPARTHIYQVFREVLQNSEEVYIESKLVAGHAAFLRLGITDSALLNTMTKSHTLLTSDLDLYLEAVRQGHSAVNFNHHIEANR